MRLLRTFAPVACLLAFVVTRPVTPAAAPQHPKPSADGIVRMPGEQDVLIAAPENLNYAYTPNMGPGGALMLNATPTATFQVTYDNTVTPWSASAQAAFQAAVDIWASTIVSPSNLPIRVTARFDTNFTSSSLLGQAGPTFVCSSAAGQANTFYAAALANRLNNAVSCAPSTTPYEIDAHFNSSFTNWDFGTAGVPVTGKYNFETVVLHELGHGLGFYGSMTSASGVGTHDYDGQGFPGVVDIFDRFVVNGTGTSILSIPYPSTALHAQLTGNNTFFSGTNTLANNSGQAAKIETHNFTTDYNRTSDNGWVQGSSYSHTDDVLYSATSNGLMTYALAMAEVYTDPGPIVRGVFKDEGWQIAGSCTYSLSPTSATIGKAAATGSVALTTQAGCAWTATSSDTSIATITSAASGTGSATITYSVTANSGASQRAVNLNIGGQTFTITQNGTGPTITLDRSSLIFGAVTNGASFLSKTSTQTVRITQTGTGTVSWTATPSASWMSVSPASGTGSATLSISVNFATGLAGSPSGTVALTFTGAGNSPGPIGVTLNVLQNGTSTAPTGSFDTPANGITGVAGSIGVTGWAMDDVEVSAVNVCRDPITGEAAGVDSRCNSLAKVFIGTAVFIDGARTDVQAAFPSSPRNTRAGWGYLMLTNFLPNTGNGTFVLHAYATDADGHSAELSAPGKTITCSNASSPAPFGAIDTPGQGDVVSGSAYANFGWVLSPGAAKADPPDGGTVVVQVDGVTVGSPGAWGARSDLTTLFPVASYSGVGKALGVFGLDTTALTNGVHSIAWIVTATAGGTSGVGSRFITVSNGAQVLDASAQPALQVLETGAQTGSAVIAAGAQAPSPVIAARATLDVPRAARLRLTTALTLASEIGAAPVDGTAIDGRRGFDLEAPLQAYPIAGGAATVQAEELDRVELHVHGSTGYLRTPSGLAPLPIGSHLDPSTGTFTWQAGVGFVGTYDLVFVRWSGGHAVARQDVRIVLNPKGSNRVGPQTIIDLPAVASAEAGLPAEAGSHTTASVASTLRWKDPIVVAGWATDLDAAIGTGVDTVHVWAYPIDPAGTRQDPIFLGVATYGGARPDVGAIYGARFTGSGYGLIVRDLAPGTYDLAVFAYSTVRGEFTSARTVRVTVR